MTKQMSIFTCYNISSHPLQAVRLYITFNFPRNEVNFQDARSISIPVPFVTLVKFQLLCQLN